MPRGPHESQHCSRTRWPTARSSTAGPTSTTSATTSWPSTCGNEMNAVIEKSDASPSPMSMNTCLVSEPQMPVSRLRSTTQSSPSNVGSGTSCNAIGVVASPCSRRRSRSVPVVGRLLGRCEAGVDTEHQCSHESGA